MSTTLITFMLEVPSCVFSVELLGSWDNFTRPYALRKDRRTGSGHWRGCHTFKNITCDGDGVKASAGRDGGLMMGGKYWYYYRLDGDVEYHDWAEPSTTLCPFLPGQCVNILEVPVQLPIGGDDIRNESTSFLGSTEYTLNPKDKYLTPKPSFCRTDTRLSANSSSKVSPKGIYEQPPIIGAKVSPHLDPTTSMIELGLPVRARTSRPAWKQSSLLVVFHKLRGTKSANSSTWQDFKDERRELCPARPKSLLSQTALTTPVLERPVSTSAVTSAAPAGISNTFQYLSAENKEQATRPFKDPAVNLAPRRDAHENISHSVSHLSLSRTYTPESGVVPGAFRRNYPPFEEPSSRYVPLGQLRKRSSSFAQTSRASWDQTSAGQDVDVLDPASDALGGRTCPIPKPFHEIPHPLGTEYGRHPTQIDLLQAEISFLDDESEYDSRGSSICTNEIFSPALATSTVQTGAMSPYRLSQPEIPSRSDPGDDILDSKSDLDPTAISADQLGQLYSKTCFNNSTPKLRQAPYLGANGFAGYSLPEEEQSSAATLRKLPGTACKTSNGESPFRQQGSKDLVQSWNDGSEHRMTMTAMEELVDDLGYLGELII